MSGGEKGRGRMGLGGICKARLERVTRDGYLGGEGARKRRMEAGIAALLKEKRASSRGSGQSGESGESHVSNSMLLLLLLLGLREGVRSEETEKERKSKWRLDCEIK